MHIQGLLLTAALPAIAVAAPHGGAEERDVVPLVGSPISLGEVQRVKLSQSGLIAGAVGVPLVDPQIIAAGIPGQGDINKAVCKNLGSWHDCVRTALVAVIGGALLVRPDQVAPSQSIQINYLPGYTQPTAACGFQCTMQPLVPADGIMKHFAYVTANGMRYGLHYARGGVDMDGLSLLRSVELGPAGAADTEGGVIVDYLFSNPDINVWNGFTARQAGCADAFSDLVTNVLANSNTLIACANFQDVSTDALSGLVSVGWNNQPFQFGTATIPSVSTYYNKCSGMR